MGTNAWRIGLLSGVAGAVDTFGYLALGQVFITHVSGNTGVLAISLVHGQFGEAFHRGAAVPIFFVGAACGAALVESAEDHRAVARALLIEALLLAVFAAAAWIGGSALRTSTGGWLLLLTLLAAATGLQNAALTHPGTRGTHTTHITGPVTELAMQFTRRITPSRRHEFDAGQTARFAARLAGFTAGALAGAVLSSAAPTAGPLVPAAVLVGLALGEGARAAA
jgi:uncharacterized membrane protein YoaK (UPF0700 family)